MNIATVTSHAAHVRLLSLIAAGIIAFGQIAEPSLEAGLLGLLFAGAAAFPDRVVALLQGSRTGADAPLTRIVS